MAIEQSLVNETYWRVAGFEHGQLESYHPISWIFHPNHTLSAQDHWTGTWIESDVENRISVTIEPAVSIFDKFDVVFLSSSWFVAVKNYDLYRLGKRN